ncbi:hypothetical protein P152DRAFT_478639 [Eremomyces bilateralis CBS 781.70]|uniref:Uncharacterized protein n=1 Tax=Eremomyces bilateralis CBS 781.70 TaxID=1392243 RepID=A0A6G1GDD2_9PEZI|nr:uncharacterized protein P152DRAFT_478639 [Eremomyces bilateralis CBS 781.70]KAF1816043.1 hypothetical protein P152DRAFT_478639 [Eremomyces bilateralis CBS 781.70]
MSLFHRKRASSHSVPSAPPSADAVTAASQVFMRSRNSSTSLSSAAAATALRTHVTPPTDVASVQTKRILRRDSTSSAGSSGSGGRAPFSAGLQRQNSTGSMTERTFRGQSPNRSPSVHMDAPPPVPPLPKQVEKDGTLHRRASSAQSPTRVLSSPTRPSGRGSSMDRGSRTAQNFRHPRVSSLSQVPELEREGSQRSINFSRPISPPSSPPAAQYRTGQGGWFTAPVITDLKPRETPSVKPDPTGSPVTGLMVSRHAPAETSERLVYKRPQQRLAQAQQGTKHTAGTMRTKPSGTAVHHSIEPAEPLSPEPTPVLVEPPEEPPHVEYITPSPERQSQQQPMKPVELRPQPEEHLPLVAAVNDNLRTKQVSPRTLPPLVVDGSRPRPQPASLDPESAESTSSHSSRAASLSPPRQAHFATNTLTPTRHQPLPRSASPAKSALKRSPSRAVSPEDTMHTATAAPGDSPEAQPDSPRRRKGARVSFDQEAVVFVPDVESERRSSPLASSPIDNDDFDHEFMKPRPALPSFGSIRGRRNRDLESDPAEKVTETVSSSMNNSIGSLDSSNDHAVAGIIARDFASRKQPAVRQESEAPRKAIDPNVPLAPEVTSVEGTGYESDTSTSGSDLDVVTESMKALTLTKGEEQPVVEIVPLPSIPEADSAGQPTTPEPSNAVPIIAISPATPKPEKQAKSKERYFMPGEFPASVSELDLSAKEPSYVRGANTPTRVEPAPPIMDTSSVQDEDSSDDSSIYSDAAEDISDAEGGFASLDAIVINPSVATGRGTLINPEVGPSQTKSSTGPDVPDVRPRPGATDWEAEKAYWSDIVQQQRQERERGIVTSALGDGMMQFQHAQHAPPAAEPDTPLETEIMPRKRKAKNSRPGHQPRAAPTRAIDVDSVEPENVPPMRKSMRPTSATTGMAASKHAPPPGEQRGTFQKRRMSPPKTTAPRPVSAMAATGPAAPLATPPPLIRSNSADSVSSFRRSRPPRSLEGGGGRFMMRRTMRDSGHDRSRATANNHMARIRSLSPPDSDSRKMKSTMRASSDTSSLSKPARSKSLFPGFGKGKKKNKTPAALAAQGAGLRFKSRFADSSDEGDDDRPMRATFTSRIVDSDDEDEVIPPLDLAPVRGIPRRTTEADQESTELEDEESDDDRSTSRPGIPTSDDINAAHGKPATNGANGLEASRHAPAKYQKKKRGFFGLGKKKDESPLSQVQVASADKQPLTPVKSALKQPPKNTDDEPTPLSPTSRSPKLHKRPKQPRVPSDSWPLPTPKRSEAAEERPNTSDGTPQGASVTFADDETGSHASEPVTGRTGKKKKFTMLRKAFGLRD